MYRRFAVFAIAFTLLCYSWYNLPFVQQIFASIFYVETPSAQAENKYANVVVTLGAPSFLFYRNNQPFKGGQFGAIIKYKVDDKLYSVDKFSYIRPYLYGTYPSIYYFPLYPAFGVVNKDFPTEKHIKLFENTTYIFLAYLIAMRWRWKKFRILKDD